MDSFLQSFIDRSTDTTPVGWVELACSLAKGNIVRSDDTMQVVSQPWLNQFIGFAFFDYNG